MRKRGIFFSTDAIIAMTMIIAVLLIAYPHVKTTQKQSDLPQDILKSLSSLRVEEIQDATVQLWISQGIVDGKKILLDQIGILAITDINLAKTLANISLAHLNTQENIGLWYDNRLIFSINQTTYESAKNIESERYLISGIGGLNGTGIVAGFSARGFLSSSLRTDYHYFGGYVGDGNITATTEYYGNIASAQMELAISKNFSVYINGISAGSYLQSPSDLIPSSYSLDNYLNSFNSGNNTIEIRGDNVRITGGFIKIIYDSNVTYHSSKKHYLPGISGLINLYDGFYLPSGLSSIEITLDMDSNYTTFLNLGNVTLFNSTTVGRELIKLNNSYILSKIGSYSSLENQTIPLRLGLENLSIIPISQVDVISVTDLSGSMAGTKMTNAKNANILLVDVLLNSTKNRVGLVGFESFVKISDFHNLSNNSNSLKNTINNQWGASGNTCICCGILKAISCIDNMTFADNFNGQVVGSNPIGWFVSDTSNSPINIDPDSLEGDRAVKVVRGSSNPHTYHRFNPQQDSTSIEFRINNSIESGNNAVRVEIEGVDSGGTSYDDYIIFKMYNGQIRNNDNAVVAYNLNSAYKIKISLTPGSSTYSLYVNDVLISSSLSVLSTRDNIASVRLTTEGSNSNRLNYTFDDFKVYLNADLCSNTFNKSRAMVVMSDGAANRACGMDPVQDWDGDTDVTDDPEDHAVQAACNAKNNYNFTVHSVAFSIAQGSSADQTMQQVASCGGGSYYSSNLTQLVQIYQEIANLILATYTEQTLNSLVGNLNTQLYPQSYIELQYPQKQSPFGLIITAENKFSNSTAGNFSLPANSTIIDAKATSYSGAKWTNKVRVNNNLIYDLIKYGNTFISLGDPYSINLPVSFISQSENNVSISTAVSSTNTSVGSTENKIIYTIAKNLTAFSPIAAMAQGCVWTIGLEGGGNLTTAIPSSYSGPNVCSYNGAQKTYNSNDAYQVAVYYLLQALDFNSNGLVDVQLSQQSLQIDISQITGIPYTWQTEVQVRTWN